MRKIRFRAWHKGINKMLYPPLPIDSMLDARDSEGNHVEIEQKASETVNMPARMTWDGRCYVEGFLQPLELMQLTGLKDKNGKEIFEGDIVRYSLNKESFVYTIEWVDFFSAFMLVSKDDSYTMTQSMSSAIELLGNIFENPELLN